MTEKVETLLKEVSKTLKRKNEELKKTFNAFDMAKIGSEETRHSAIIAALLDPQSPFGTGAESLKAFFRQVGLDEIAKHCNEKTMVSTECSIPGRRMDIVIRSNPDTEFCVVIENKTMTVDHEQQLEDYQKWLNLQKSNQKKLLYLTYNGDPAQNYQKDDYKSISYRKHICNWLRECALMHQGNTAKSVFCSQYCDFITNTLLERKREMDENLRTTIINNFKSALEISSGIDETKAFLLNEVFTKQVKMIDGFDVLEKEVNEIKTGRGLDYNVSFRDPRNRYVIELGFDHYYFWGSRTLIRFNGLSPENIKQIKTSFDSEGSLWRIEKSSDSLVLGNHHNEITLNDDFFCALAAKDDAIITNVRKQYIEEKDKADAMANSILDLLKRNELSTQNAEGTEK